MSTLTHQSGDTNNNERLTSKQTLKERNTTLAANKPFLELDQYSIALTRLTSGHQNLSDLAQTLKERAQLEQNYANSLKNWAERSSKIIIKGGEYNTTRQSWLDGLDEARSLANIHQKIAENILEKPHKKIGEWQKTHYHSKLMGGFKETDRLEKDFRKSQKPWSKLYKNQINNKKIYHNNCLKRKTCENQIQNLELQLKQYEENYSPKIEGTKAKLNKKQDEMVQIENDVHNSRENYIKSVDECSNYASTYESEMQTVYDKSQAEEEGRLRFIKDIFMMIHEQLDLTKNGNYTQLYIKHYQDLNKMSPTNDVKWWNNARGMGINMNWPTFEEYDQSSLLNSVTHNQSERASKHIAGSTNIETKGYVSKETSVVEESGQLPIAGGTATVSKKILTNGDGPEQVRNEFSESATDLDPTSESSQRFESLDVKAYNGWDKKSSPKKPSSEPVLKPVEVVVLYNYEAVEADELSLVAGMKLFRIEEADEQGWCKGQLESGTEGLFPAEYVKEV